MKKIKNKQGKRVSRAMKAQNALLKAQENTSNNLQTITVKNAEGDPDTVAQIVVQNQINYTPKVSVIIPVYNVEQYLRECLDSVINQTLKEIEIICVDDGSTDKSLDILLEYAAKDNRITVLKQENLHAGVARNAGLAVARGEYIHFLDSDDWIDVDTYEKLHMIISKYNADIVKFRSYTYDNVKCEIKNSYFTNIGGVPEKYFNQFINWKKDYNILINISDAPWSGIYKRKFLTYNNIYFDNLLCANDVSFFYRCLIAAKMFYLSNNRFVYYRVNNSSSLIGIRAYNFDCQLQQFDNINKIILKEPINIIQTIRKHLIHSIFYRYLQYINNPLLDVNTKEKITTEIISFTKNIKESEVASEYIDHYNSLSHNTKVSVIIPIYNTEKYLKKCLDSVINQTLKDIEIICVNDGSTDNSLKILQEYAEKDKRIVIINQKNYGSAAARNKAISIAKGDYIGFIDSDDYIDTNYYQSLLLSALKNNADIAATSECRLFNSTGIISYKNLGLNTKKIIESIEDKGNIITTTGVSCNKIYKKNFISKNCLSCLEVKNAAEDNYFTDTSIICANKISVVNDVTYYYRITEGSQTQVKKNNTQFSITDVYKAIDNFILSLKINKNDKKKWLDIINRRKILDFGHFFNTMDEQYKDDFKKHFRNVFPNLDINTKIPIVSLTSYPARIKFVISTIQSLINQSIQPQKIILNLGTDKFPNKEADLPEELLALKNDFFEISWMEKDLGSFSKLIPTLKKYPNDIIVTADDDIIYPNDWLQKLIISYNNNKHKKMIYCHRAHKIIMKKGKFLPYKRWIFGVNDNSASYWNFLTGVGGVLYPPNSLHKDVFKTKLFEKLCPKADDIWFWAMAVLNKTKIKIITNPYLKLNITNGSQDIECLWKTNLAGIEKNNEQFANVLKQYPQILRNLKRERYQHLSIYLLFPYYLLKLHILHRQYFEALAKYIRSFRLDIKNLGSAENAVSITAPNAQTLAPAWFTNAQGEGQLVKSSNTKQKLTIKAIKSGTLRLDFRGQDKRDTNGTRFPLWIDYKSIKVNGKELLSAPIATWHDKPYRYEMSVKDGQEITVELEQQPHPYTRQELKELILKLYPNSDYITQNIDTIANTILPDNTHKNSNHKKVAVLGKLKHFFYHKTITDSYTKTYICGVRVRKKPANIYSFIDRRLAEFSKTLDAKLSKLSEQLSAGIAAATTAQKELLAKVNDINKNTQTELSSMQKTIDNRLNDLEKETQFLKSNGLYTIKVLNKKLDSLFGMQNTTADFLSAVQKENRDDLLAATEELRENLISNSENNRQAIIKQIDQFLTTSQKQNKTLQSNLQASAETNRQAILSQVEKVLTFSQNQAEILSAQSKALSAQADNITSLQSNLQASAEANRQAILAQVEKGTVSTLEQFKEAVGSQIVNFETLQNYQNESIKSLLAAESAKTEQHFTEQQKNQDTLSKQISDKTSSVLTAIEREQVLYSNPFEVRTREERGLCDIVNAPNFENRFKKLIANLPQESAATIVDIIKRLQLIKGTTNKLDLYSTKEKQLLKDLKIQQQSILKISDNLYCYKNYFLPINHFEPSVFLYKHGLDKLQNLQYFKDKAILDIGAFIGDSALILSPFTNNKVYSFEATNENYNNMLETIKINNLTNVIPVKTAVGAEKSTIDIRYDGSASSSSDIMIKTPKYIEKCPVIRIDDYVKEHNLNVGLIKVDIEGAEQDFIKGAINTIKTQKPTMLISIYHNIDDFLDIKPIIEDLNLGYKFTIFKPVIGSISGETLLICEQ